MKKYNYVRMKIHKLFSEGLPGKEILAMKGPYKLV